MLENQIFTCIRMKLHSYLLPLTHRDTHTNTSLITQLVKNPPAVQEILVQFLGSGRSAGEGISYPLQYSWASLVAQMERICLEHERPGFNPRVGKIPLQYSCLENPQGQRSLPGYSPWGRKEPDTTEQLSTHISQNS